MLHNHHTYGGVRPDGQRLAERKRVDRSWRNGPRATPLHLEPDRLAWRGKHIGVDGAHAIAANLLGEVLDNGIAIDDGSGASAAYRRTTTGELSRYEKPGNRPVRRVWGKKAIVERIRKFGCRLPISLQTHPIS